MSTRRLLLIAVLLSLSSSAAMAQMGSSVTYTDKWVDSSNPNAPRIVGSGVTQDYNNIYGHTYWVETTITSPTGRTVIATSYRSNSYARVETSLPWDWNNPDPGDYQIIQSIGCAVPTWVGTASPIAAPEGRSPPHTKDTLIS